MKLITPEEEQAHYNAVVAGGAIGGAIGLTVGCGGAIIASRRYPAFRNLTLPFKAFLVTSTSTFGAIVEADRWSMDFERSRDPNRFYRTEDQKLLSEARSKLSADQQILTLAREHRYKIVLACWVASMAASLSIVGRSKYLSAAQKIVQARVYAQGLTLAVLVATAALELGDAKSGAGRWETVMVVDPNDPEHKRMIEKKIHKEEYVGQDLWKDMVAAEERRLATLKNEKEISKAATQ
ncbi:mitochondrial hypoxia responsive domain-containing protein [Zalerion maritima]|uniref:Mitochondrial hypoxia responsive domain-containing protein n=1 Tax=Zalerion maritima TaxID=339359 RepID=A0AAD5RG12_9PEZI|nr:mitochondrial hypoxia responsive domain-containing protein [Zalerion maritima]